MRQQSIDRQIEELNRRIEVREERLLRYEDRLIKQFTALERAVASMQNQSQDLREDDWPADRFWEELGQLLKKGVHPMISNPLL